MIHDSTIKENLSDDTLTQSSFDERFGLESNSKVAVRTPTKKMKKTSKNPFLSFFPIIDWLPKYNIKENLINDIVGGLTVGIMHVPQGMAYASLAGVRPVNGLYTSLFPALFYMIFGTSRHVSLGVFAVVSLMVGSCNLRVTDLLVQERNMSIVDLVDSDDTLYHISMEVITSLTLLVGLIQIAMAVLRLDFLTSFLSDQIIAGFTTGAAVHVLVAQLNKILGVTLPRHSGFGKLYFILTDLTRSVTTGQVNPVTLAISIITMVSLYCMKEYLNPIIKKKCKLPIPYELFVMILGTIISMIFDLNGRFNVKIIGVIPTGLPYPSMPEVTIFHFFIKDAFAIAIVSLVVTVSMGKLFAKKHQYEVDVRQEFYAMGFMESLSALFPVWPSSTALARTLVYEAAGTKTQLATIFSSTLLLTVILFIGPFVEVLPTCFLSCIIIVALKGMFMQMKQIPVLWVSCRTDCAIFVITMLSTVALDVVEGLVIGILFSLAIIIYRMQSSHLIELGQLKKENEKDVYFRPIEAYSESTRVAGVSLVHFPCPLLFLNIEQFRKQLDLLLEETPMSSSDDLSIEYKNAEVRMPIDRVVNKPLKHVIIDLSAVTYIDFSGMQCLIEVVKDLKKVNVALSYANATSLVMSTLESSAAFTASGISSQFFPSIQDAISSVPLQES